MFTLNRALNTLNRFPFGVRCEHVLPKLPFPANALEPVICAEIMELHHQKHHNTYIQNLNAAESELQDAMAKCDLPKMISLQPALKFNGGGHLNHSILWKNLSPCGGQPSEELMRVLCNSFGSFDAMKDEMRAAANGIQGSGWAWLGYNKKTGRLQVATCSNQDPLQPTTGLVPLLGIDVWEHAYYLQYKNVRAEYTKRLFDIINWNDVSDRFARGKC